VSEGDPKKDGGEPVDPASGRPADVVPPTKIERPTAAAPEPPAPAQAAAKPAGRRIEDAPAPKPKPRSAVELGHPGDPPPWWRTLRADPPAHIRIALGAAFIAFLIFLWWLATRGAKPWISANLVPSPGFTLESAPGLFDRHFDDHFFTSIRRVLIGISLAAFFGVGLGILAGAQRGLAAALNPLVVFLRSIPMGALGPLTLAIFSTGEKQRWMFIFIAVVPFVFSDALKAVSSVPQRYVETAETLGATRWQIVRKVLVPLALPDIITSLRFQFGLALGYIVLVETTGFQDGLGGMFSNNDRVGHPEHTWAMLFALAAIAFLIDYTIRYFQRHAFPYRKDL
jgi:ABC-type nitrate/sulfonate/bicarbonate transport system permease component